MFLALGQAVASQPDHAAPGEQGADLGDAQFNRLLDREVHALALGDADPQVDPKGQGRFGLTGLTYPDQDLLPVGGEDRGGIITAIPIKDDEVVAGSQPQYLNQVLDRRGGQGQVLTGRQGQIHENAVLAHDPLTLPPEAEGQQQPAKDEQGAAQGGDHAPGGHVQQNPQKEAAAEKGRAQEEGLARQG